MLIPDDALAMIDAVSDNRSAFMISAALAEAKRRKRELDDAEIAEICRQNYERDREIAAEWDGTLLDGLGDLDDTW